MTKNWRTVDYSKRFNKQLKKTPLKIKIAFKERLSIFIKDKFHPRLNNHALVGLYRGYRSINVSGDWRAIYREVETKNEVIIFFDLLGTHSRLYK